MSKIPDSAIQFLQDLRKNNNRDWFNDHKDRFRQEQKQVKGFFQELLNELRKHDEIDTMKMFRIYRDVRFSNDKTPYKSHFSGAFHRLKPRLRGGYYLHIEPGSSFIGAGFWAPEKEDLYRIRKEFETDDQEIRKILNDKMFIKYFGELTGDELKTAPKGFDREHPAIDLIRKKQFIVTRKFTDAEITANNFLSEADETFRAIRPFFDYMSDVLTTDLNGVSLIE
ncbi:DUF2461 domain-containing protein [Robertkochia aurantiaca]|uniref:DUF2461 domain-containing protein n=1 Tax=Robertkochia aurantiaca TaxID=2873700 RepID=UPI001CCCC4EC|nr:DUF2461 domain-containing protein [Robertkochia sp. 3YJGBD-33]